METSKLIFVFVSALCFIIIPLFLKNVRRYYLAFASFIYVFTSGWIFYHYTGLMLADLPILGLLTVSFLERRRIRLLPHPVGWPLVGFILLGLLSATWAKQPGWALAEVSKYFRMYLLILVLLDNIRSLSDLRLVVHWMLIGFLIESLIGIYQWKFGALGIWFLGERPASRIDWRSMGTFYVTSFYANYLVMVLSVALRMFIFYRPSKLLLSIFYGAASLLGLLAFYTTYARGPWIAFLVAFGIVFLLSFLRSRYKIRSQWAVPVVLVGVLALFIRYHNQIFAQFGESRRVSYEVRFTQYDIAGRMIMRYPLQGVGLGNYEENVGDYLTQEERSSYLVSVYLGMVHNSYFLITAELGFPGGIVFVLFFITIGLTILEILRSRLNHSFIVNTTLGILGGVIAICTCLLSSPDIHEYSLLYQIGLFCGILLAEKKLLRQALFMQKQKKGISSTHRIPIL